MHATSDWHFHRTLSFFLDATVLQSQIFYLVIQFLQSGRPPNKNLLKNDLRVKYESDGHCLRGLYLFARFHAALSHLQYLNHARTILLFVYVRLEFHYEPKHFYCFLF